MFVRGAMKVYKTKNLYQKAFTLAEVLITIGAIGIIAAMTLPTLIDNSRKKQYITSFKKDLSTLNQAVQLAESNYDYNFATIGSNCIKPSTEKAPETLSICGMFNSLLKASSILGYTELKTKYDVLYYNELFKNNPAKDSVLKNQGIELYYVRMIDGSLFAFHAPRVNSKDDIRCTLKGKTLEEALNNKTFQKYCVGFIDVNGITPPNKEVRCNDNKVHTTDINASCSVDKDSAYLYDIFPVAYFDSNVVPASAAARAVLLLE